MMYNSERKRGSGLIHSFIHLSSYRAGLDRVIRGEE